MTAHTATTLVMSVPQLVMNAFSPVMTHSPPCRSARVLKPAVHEPAWGSVPAPAAIAVPAAIQGRKRSFCC